MRSKIPDWVCGRVQYPGNANLGIPPVTCGEAVAWVPYVHIRRGGEEDCHILMGAHALCTTCRLKFKLNDLKQFAMWPSVLSGFREEGRAEPKDKEIEIEWISVEDFQKDQDNPFPRSIPTNG